MSIFESILPWEGEMKTALDASRKTRKMVSDMLALNNWTDAQRTELLAMSAKLAGLENPVAKFQDDFFAGLALPWTFVEAMTKTKALATEVANVQGKMVAMDQARMAAHGVAPVIPGLVRKYNQPDEWPWWKWVVVAAGTALVATVAVNAYLGRKR